MLPSQDILLKIEIILVCFGTLIYTLLILRIVYRIVKNIYQPTVNFDMNPFIFNMDRLLPNREPLPTTSSTSDDAITTEPSHSNFPNYRFILAPETQKDDDSAVSNTSSLLLRRLQVQDVKKDTSTESMCSALYVKELLQSKRLKFPWRGFLTEENTLTTTRSYNNPIAYKYSSDKEWQEAIALETDYDRQCSLIQFYKTFKRSKYTSQDIRKYLYVNGTKDADEADLLGLNRVHSNPNNQQEVQKRGIQTNKEFNKAIRTLTNTKVTRKM